MLCSVIIPYYNDALYITEAIRSVQQQTYKQIEIIVVDDGSADLPSIEALTHLDKSITVLYKANGGLASARNYGIERCNGEVIITLDSDDKFAATFIEEAITHLNKNSQTGVVSSYVQEFGNSHHVWRTAASDDFSFFTENRLVACCAFRKVCWQEAGGYDEKMRWGYEDWEFWIRVTQKGWKVHIIPKKLFFYRKKKSSMLADETRPRMMEILDYLISKHQPWFIASLKKGIAEKNLINKKTLTLRRIAGLFIEKLQGKF